MHVSGSMYVIKSVCGLCECVWRLYKHCLILCKYFGSAKSMRSTFLRPKQVVRSQYVLLVRCWYSCDIWRPRKIQQNRIEQKLSRAKVSLWHPIEKWQKQCEMLVQLLKVKTSISRCFFVVLYICHCGCCCFCYRCSYILRSLFTSTML